MLKKNYKNISSEYQRLLEKYLPKWLFTCINTQILGVKHAINYEKLLTDFNFSLQNMYTIHKILTIFSQKDPKVKRALYRQQNQKLFLLLELTSSLLFEILRKQYTSLRFFSTITNAFYVIKVFGRIYRKFDKYKWK